MIGRQEKKVPFPSQVYKLFGTFAWWFFVLFFFHLSVITILGKASSFLQTRFDKIELIG